MQIHEGRELIDENCLRDHAGLNRSCLASHTSPLPLHHFHMHLLYQLCVDTKPLLNLVSEVKRISQIC